jgi:DNA repair ATPase RecN
MPEPIISSTTAPTIATTNPTQDQPIIAKGFNDPAFLQGIDKAFSDAKAQREQSAKPELTQKMLDDTTEDLLKHGNPLKPEPEPKTDRPPVPRKAAEWAEFHDAKTKVEKERDELKSRLDKFNGFDPKEYEEIKTERQKLSEKLEAIALERSDKFQKYFNESADNIRALVKSAVGDKAEKVIKLLDMPDSDWRTEQLEAITEDLTPLRRAKMERAFADMDKLAIERNKVIDNSQESAEP